MALQKLFYQFEDLIKKIDTKIRNEDFKDLDITTQNINDLKTLLTSSSKSLDDVDREMYNLSNDKQREYVSKLKIYRSDYDTRRANIFKLEEKLSSKQKINKLTTNPGNMSKGEMKKAERDAVIDVNKNVDYHQELLNDIGKDLSTAQLNMNNVVTNVKGQGATIYRIKDGVKDVETSNNRTNKNINLMLRRNFCHKCLLHVLAFVLFLSIIAAFIYKVCK